MTALESFAQHLTAQLGDKAHYKIVATVYKGEIANVHAQAYIDDRRLDCDVADYGTLEDDPEANQINDLTELVRDLIAATKNPPKGDIALTELEAFGHAAQELETFLHDHGYDGPATIADDDN